MSRYEKEWPCCGDISITNAYEPEACPFCAPPSIPKQAPQIDYSVLHSFASMHRVPYNDLCAAVDRALKEQQQ